MGSNAEFRRVAARIRDSITAGVYERGAALPTEDQLAALLGVSRGTVNDAVQVLRAEGLIRIHRGKGMFVTDLPPIMRNASARYLRATREQGHGAFDVEIRRLGKEPRSDVTVDRVPVPAAVAPILEVEEGELVVARARQMYAGDIPVQLATSYIPIDLADGTPLEQQDSGPGGIVSRFADLGHAQVQMGETVRVRTPDEDEARFLRMTPDQRVFEITHVGREESGRAVEVCLHIMPTHQWTLGYDWPVQ